MSPPIGIDLGTRQASVSAFISGKIELVASFSMFVTFLGENQLIGEKAKFSLHSNPRNTVFGMLLYVCCFIVVYSCSIP